MWGVLKLGDPQVTISFNTEMISFWFILDDLVLPSISGNLHVDDCAVVLWIDSCCSHTRPGSVPIHCVRTAQGPGSTLSTPKTATIRSCRIAVGADAKARESGSTFKNGPAGCPNRSRGPILGPQTQLNDLNNAQVMCASSYHLQCPAGTIWARVLWTKNPLAPGHRPLRTADGLNMITWNGISGRCSTTSHHAWLFSPWNT